MKKIRLPALFFPCKFSIYAILTFSVLFNACKKDSEPLPEPLIESFTPISGLPFHGNTDGTMVTITGKNFSARLSDNKLQFNETNATIISASKTELVTMVPHGATTGKIKLSIGNKTVVSLTDFTVIPYPEIINFDPLTGVAGSIVIINGRNFSNVAEANVVKFNMTQATVTHATSTTLTVNVPLSAETGKITVTSNGASAMSSMDFAVLPSPAITSIAPLAGIPGTLVTITGRNFATEPDENIVKFNGSPAAITTVSSTQLTVMVPQQANTGKISIMVNGIETISSEDFIVHNAPIITSFSPLSALTGSALSIEGVNFSLIPENNIVKFNDVPAVVLSASGTNLVVSVPTGAVTGRISVIVNDLTALSEENFTLILPVTISSFSPLSATAGTSITIAGANFNITTNLNLVKFNTTAAVVTSASATQLRVNVPAGFVSGKISVTTNGTTAYSEDDFNLILPPVLTSFAPTTGGAGTSLIISGSNFSLTPSQNRVKFYNNIDAPILSASTTQLVVQVPTGATTGKIAVTTNGLSVTSAADFQVIPYPTITSISSMHDYIGSSIIIVGNNFSATPGQNLVRFNGVQAIVLAASSDRIEVRVPQGTTTGKISITVNSYTTTSTNDFSVRQPFTFTLNPSHTVPGNYVIFNLSQHLDSQFGFLDVKLHNTTLKTIFSSTPGDFDPHLLVTIPPSATSGKILLVRNFDGVIVGESETVLQILTPYPQPGITALYKFSGDFSTFPRNLGEFNDTRIHLNHPFFNKALPSFTMDRFGTTNGALTFNGDQACTTTTDRLLGKPWTISFWISYDALPPNVFNNGGISTILNNSGVTIAMIQRNGVVGADLNLNVTVDDMDAPGTSAELTDFKNDPAFLPLAGTNSQWINLTITYSGSLFRIYKNGVVVVEKVITGNKGGNGGPVLRLGEAGGYYYKGKMDDVFIYDAAMSAGDVLKLFEQNQTKY